MGFVAGEIRKHEATGWIATLAVTPGQRHNGIALALISSCEMQMNVKKIKLAVRRSNEPAIRLYFKLGYHQTDIWEKYYIGGEDALILEKILEGV